MCNNPRCTDLPSLYQPLHSTQACGHPSKKPLEGDRHSPGICTREKRQRQREIRQGVRGSNQQLLYCSSSGYWTMTLRILLTTLACVPAAEAFHGAPPAAAIGPPAQRLLACRSSVTQSIAASNFRQQQQQQQQHRQQQRRQPPPPRACWGDDSAFSLRATAPTSTTTAAAAAAPTTTSPRSTTTTALSLCKPSLSATSEQERLPGGEADGDANVPVAAKSSSVTLGITHSVLERTMVPALSGAVLKQSPSDFVVVELPLYAGTKFTPSDVNAPIPEPVRKPVTRKVRPRRGS